MEFWYIENDLNQKLPQAFEDWLCEHVNKVFLHEVGESNRLFRSKPIDVITYSNERVDNHNLSKDFSSSLNLANAVIEQCLTRNVPVCILINNNNRALPFFLLQNYWCKHPALNQVTIITMHNYPTKDLNESEMYKFPDYWVYQKNKFVLEASPLILSWNDQLRDDLSDFKNVLFIDQDNPPINIHQWIDNVRDRSTKYPVNSSIPTTYLKDESFSTEKRSLLSVIIPYYNMGALILETIQSINESSYQDIEIIIVNDGSNDLDSIQILHEIESTMQSIKVIHIVNQGLSNARNVGARAATGEFIAFLDADDLISSMYYERCVNVLNSYTNVSFVYSWVRFFGLKNDVWVTFDTEFPLLLLSNMLSAFAVIRKKHFLEYGLNKLEMEKGMEDHESWISMCENGCAGISIPEALVQYRIRSNSMSRQFNRKIVNDLYFKISHFHEDLYKQYGIEIFNLTYSNGPGYIWNNPAMTYPDVAYNSSNHQGMDNEHKYELMRIFNSKRGRVLINLFLRLKLNRWFK
ncbi:hypothetical protein A8L34_24730 [Bacillus sp. FJAT-27264]|uniref:glycosyltransferase family 2 protein n=1 Tax=Paenibacillus sp. (strain DSM 101736 / FJAT-27264) TaxID=1850362 RepID=UPI000807F846|nr:glycosyltransferase family 2 protein [Bacillus sp. FJAT-27264]OBZ07841.1 hypothetical protein A8L34_24730 [Bacillus sp. FJAT-27264]